MTTRYCFTKVFEGYTEKKAMHLLMRYTLKIMLVYSNLYLPLPIPFLLSFLNSLNFSCVFCSSSTCCIFGMSCHSYILPYRLLTRCLSIFFTYGQIYQRFNPFQTKQFYFVNFRMTVKYVSLF